jgi:predicted phosphodiesterase
MRWLILPDIHDKLRRANQIIEREPHDRLLLMGDFFDDFRTGVTDAADTANQVKQWPIRFDDRQPPTGIF